MRGTWFLAIFTLLFGTLKVAAIEVEVLWEHNTFQVLVPENLSTIAVKAIEEFLERNEVLRKIHAQVYIENEGQVLIRFSDMFICHTVKEIESYAGNLQRYLNKRFDLESACCCAICEYGNPCCLCNAYDYVVACMKCAPRAHSPECDKEPDPNLMTRLFEARSPRPRPAPEIILPQLSFEFLRRWSSSPRSPKTDSPKSPFSSSNTPRTSRCKKFLASFSSDAEDESM